MPVVLVRLAARPSQKPPMPEPRFFARAGAVTAVVVPACCVCSTRALSAAMISGRPTAPSGSAGTSGGTGAGPPPTPGWWGAAPASGAAPATPRDASQASLSGSAARAVLPSMALTMSATRAERTVRLSFMLSGTLMTFGTQFDSLYAASTASTPSAASAARASAPRKWSRCVMKRFISAKS